MVGRFILLIYRICLRQLISYTSPWPRFWNLINSDSLQSNGTGYSESRCSRNPTEGKGLSSPKTKTCHFYPGLKCFDIKMTGILSRFYFPMQFSPSKKPLGFLLDQTTIRLEIHKDINHAISDYRFPITSLEAVFQHCFPYSLQSQSKACLFHLVLCHAQWSLSP